MTMAEPKRQILDAVLISRIGRQLWPMLGFFVVVTPLVALTANSYWLSVFASSAATALVVSGTAVLYGRLGLVSLCQFALAGVGGWIALRVHHAFHLPFEVSLFAGGLGACVIGVLWGLPALRLKGLYLALVTLMFAGAFQVAINVWGFPNGGPGFLGQVSGIPRVMMARPSLATSDPAYTAYVMVLLLLGLVLIEAHRRTRVGRSWALIRKNEAMAAAAGIPITFYKTWAFALAGFLAGIGGGALAGTFGQLDSAAFSASESILLFALTVVGGASIWLGAIVAAVVMRAVPALFNDVGVNGYVATIIFGAALIHALVNTPDGVSGQISTLVKRLFPDRREKSP